MLIYWHMLFVFIWALSFVGAIKSFSCGQKDAKILTLLSLISMLVVLVIGTKIMLLMPQVSKSGMWIHIKLSLDIVAMLINVYLGVAVFKNKPVSGKVLYAMFWVVAIMFVIMYALTLFKPF